MKERGKPYQTPTGKREKNRKRFERNNINDSAHFVVFLDGNEGVKRLLPQPLEDMLIIFKRKKENDKTEKEEDGFSCGLYEGKDKRDNNSCQINESGKIM